jgi:flagellar biosynthesis component FlhA
MKVSNGDIFNAREALQTLMKERLPVKVSYRLAKLAKKVNDQLAIIEEVRQGLVKQYGEPDEKGENIQILAGSKNMAPFLTDLNELMGQEVDIDSEIIKLPEEGLTIEPSVLLALDKFIEVG